MPDARLQRTREAYVSKTFMPSVGELAELVVMNRDALKAELRDPAPNPEDAYWFARMAAHFARLAQRLDQDDEAHD